MSLSMSPERTSRTFRERRARSRRTCVLLLAIGFLPRGGEALLAFDCAGAFWLTPLEQLESAALVFHGEATAVEPVNSLEFRFEVFEVWKGPLREGSLTVVTDTEDWGGFPFVRGVEYIVYAWPHGAGEYWTTSCSRTAAFRPAEAAALGASIWTAPGRQVAFRRGDVDSSGELDITDALASLDFQFLGTFSPPCIDAVDTDDSGEVDVTDAVLALRHQFLGASPPSPPFSECGEDPTDDALNCSRFDACRRPFTEANEIVSIVTDEAELMVSIELFSERAFPVRALDPVLFIGERIFMRYDLKNGDLHTLVYTLGRRDFDRLPDAPPVSVQYTLDALPGSDDFWDFGILDKTRLSAR